MKNRNGKKKSNAPAVLMMLLTAALAVLVIIKVGPGVSGQLKSVIGQETVTEAAPGKSEMSSQPAETVQKPEQTQAEETPDIPASVPETEVSPAEPSPEAAPEENPQPYEVQEEPAEENPEAGAPAETAEPEPEPGIFGDAGIEIVRLYPSEEPVCNTDGDGSVCTDLAVLEVRNGSQMHITSALVTVTTTEGKNLSFTIYEIPAGYTVRAYDVNGTSISAADEIASVDCQPQLRDRTRLVANKIKVQNEGTKVTVKTLTINYLYNMTFYFHELAPGETDVLLGGTTYSGTIEAMYPGQVVEFYLNGCDAENVVLCYVYPGYDG